MSTLSPWQQVQKACSQTWALRTSREKTLLLAGALLLCLVALWQWALAPALQTWREAPARQAAFDRQSQNMRQLQAQVQGLQKPSAVSRSEAALWLEKSLAELGPNAKISLQGDNVTLRVESAPAPAMARWLSQARDNAQTLPLQGQMQQLSSAPKNEVLWQGTLVLKLP